MYIYIYIYVCVRTFMMMFPVHIKGKSRDTAARRTVRGAYRTRSRIYTTGYVKPPNPKALKQNTGAHSVMVTCAIGAGKVLMWHIVQGRWNGATAARMYKELQRSLAKAHPNVKGPWRVLEDNDPTGYKSGRGLAAKKDCGIQSFDLPKRSPDLNPLDYGFWVKVNKAMRAEEREWPASKRESRDQYIARLRRTAKAIPKSEIENLIGGLRRRCELLDQARGGHFPEGGH